MRLSGREALGGLGRSTSSKMASAVSVVPPSSLSNSTDGCWIMRSMGPRLPRVPVIHKILGRLHGIIMSLTLALEFLERSSKVVLSPLVLSPLLLQRSSERLDGVIHLSRMGGHTLLLQDGILIEGQGYCPNLGVVN